MIATQVTVWCDGLPEEVSPPMRWHADNCPLEVGPAHTVPLAKRAALDAGWHLPRDHRHYSPQCWQALAAAGRRRFAQESR